MAIFQNLSIEQLISKLQELHRKRVDLVIPPSLLTMQQGDLHISEAAFAQYYATKFDTPASVSIRPNSVAHRQISDKLGIPKRYYDRMAADHPALLDENVNGWFAKKENPFLLRTYREEQGPATGRALLSRRFKCIDNIHLLLSALQTIQRKKLNVTVETADITETKMYVRFINPDAVVGAKGLLKGYKNPQTLEVGDGVMAGFTLRNSEVGMGRYEIAPRAVVLVCKNGMICERDAWGKNHLGTKLDEGAIDWSEDTYKKALSLIQSQVSDYVRHFASEKYLGSWLADLQQQGNYSLRHPVGCVQNVTRQFGLAEEDTASILDYFTHSGQNTAFGIAQAFTFHAHQIGDADKRNELEGVVPGVLQAVPILDQQDSTVWGGSSSPRIATPQRSVSQYHLGL